MTHDIIRSCHPAAIHQNRDVVYLDRESPSTKSQVSCRSRILLNLTRELSRGKGLWDKVQPHL